MKDQVPESAQHQSRNAETVSIIVPCWNDVGLAVQFAKAWRDSEAEIIIALSPEHAKEDGQFQDLDVRTCIAGKTGRGCQMNAGARTATRDILLFHHVDSQLTQAHLKSLAAAMQNGAIVGGAFHRAFDDRHPHLRWLEPLERLHGRLFGTLYGDQSIFVRREHFLKMGEFRDFPLMEDVEFSRRLRKSGRIALLDPPMSSSARKHLERGAWRTTFRNAALLFLYHAGISPTRLHRIYYSAPNLPSRVFSTPIETQE